MRAGPRPQKDHSQVLKPSDIVCGWCAEVRMSACIPAALWCLLLELEHIPGWWVLHIIFLFYSSQVLF